MAKTAIRNQIRGREGKAAVRKGLNRQYRRAAKLELRAGFEPRLPRRSLDRVLV